MLKRGSGFAVSLVAGLSALAVTPSARSTLINVEWDSAGRFERTVRIPPGKFLEVCRGLAKGQVVDWSFKSPSHVNFNLHYHEDKTVVFPIKQDKVSALAGQLTVPLDQDYCWMWSNKARVSIRVSLSMQRQH
jgi:hypothetical protein